MPQPRSTATTRRPAKTREIAEEQDDRKVVEHEAFGVTVKMRGDHLAIARVQNDGTADAAGIQNGDILISVGEIPMKRPSDITQLDDVLKAGDQVEFEIVREGKKSKQLVTFERETNVSELPTLRGVATGDAVTEPEPTLAERRVPLPLDGMELAGNDGYGDFEKKPRVDELLQLVKSQQQIIGQLQGRLRKLERTAATPTFEAPVESPRGPLFVFPTVE